MPDYTVTMQSAWSADECIANVTHNRTQELVAQIIMFERDGIIILSRIWPTWSKLTHDEQVQIEQDYLGGRIVITDNGS